jgi:hypothetical protein
LCEITGCHDPQILGEVVTASCLNRWEQYGQEVGHRDDIQWGMLLTILANQNRNKDTPPIQTDELMPYFEKQLPPIDELEARLKKSLQEKFERNRKS